MAGFVLKRFGEPCPTEEAVRELTRLQGAQVVAFFLHVKVRKPVD